METSKLMPKIENQTDLHEWLYLQDQFHLPSIFDEAPILPTITYQEAKPTNLLPTNDLLEYHPKTSLCTQNLENFSADFNLWSEYPLLSEYAWELPLSSQIPPPLFPYTIEHSKCSTFDNTINDQFLLSTFSNFSDQSLDMFFAEGLTMSQSHKNHIIMEGDNNNFVNVDYCVKKEKFKRIELICYEDIRKYFNVPISRAAKELNVGLTVLKKRCRELNIKRWPHRKIKSLEALISNVKEEKGTIEMVKFLEDYKRMLHFVPGLELDAETKRLRQQIFKANYKKRRANNKALAHIM